MEKARDILKRAYEFVKNRWSAASRTVRLVILSVAAAMLISAVALAVLSGQTNYEVLYVGVSDSEAVEIVEALRSIGISDYHFSAGTISVVSDQLEYARMQLAMQRFPRSGVNYNIWYENVGMFSTESQTREIQRQQLEYNTAATLRILNKVLDAVVLISPADERRHVFNSDREPSRVAVTLTLREKLTTPEIEGIHWLILNAVPRLESENLTITDQNGIRLIADDASSAETLFALDMQRIRQQDEFRNMFQRNIKENIESFLEGTVRDYRVMVTADIDFSNWVSDKISYEGVNIDENGFQHGPISDEQRSLIMNGMALDAGLVGMIINGDISPGYPTYDPDENGEVFLEHMVSTNYLVNKYHEISESNGFTIKGIYVGVQIDETAMTQDLISVWEELIARAVGQPMVNVSVKPTIFRPAPPDLYQPLPTQQPMRNLLVFMLIALGAVLIVLFLLAIMSSSSKKRRFIRSRGAAFQGAGGTPAFDDEYSSFNIRVPDIEDDEEDLKLQSLLGGEGAETRETLLKNEIREFAKESPDIVAQLLRTWMREGE